eukprot:tig00000057_g37.t1
MPRHCRRLPRIGALVSVADGVADPGGARGAGDARPSDRPLVDVSGGPAARVAAVKNPEDDAEAHAAFAEGERLFYAERLEEALAFFARVPHGHRRYVDALWYQACTYVGFRRDDLPA